MLAAWGLTVGPGCIPLSDPPGTQLAVQAGGCSSYLTLEVPARGAVIHGLRHNDCVELAEGWYAWDVRVTCDATGFGVHDVRLAEPGEGCARVVARVE